MTVREEIFRICDKFEAVQQGYDENVLTYKHICEIEIETFLKLQPHKEYIQKSMPEPYRDKYQYLQNQHDKGAIEERKLSAKEDHEICQDMLKVHSAVGDAEIQLAILIAYKKFFGANSNTYKYRYRDQENRFKERIRQGKATIKELSLLITKNTSKPTFYS